MLTDKKYQVYWFSLAGVLAAFLLWYFRIIALYILFAMFLTFVLNPLVNYLSKGKLVKFRVPRFISTVIAFLLFFGLLALFFATIFPLISNEVDHLKSVDPTQFTTVFDNQIYYIEHLLIDNNLTEKAPGFLKPLLTEELNNWMNQENAGNLISGFFNGITNGVIGLFSVLFISFFSLKDENLLKKSVANIIPGKYYTDYINVFNNIENLLSRYFIGLLIQATIISTIVSIALMLIGINNYILIGILVGIINVIPYLGQVISIALALLLGVASNIDIINSEYLLFFLLKITTIVVATQTLDSFIFQPIIFSKSEKAHPLEIFLMVFVGGTIAGPFGMFLAIPVYTIIKVTYIGLHRVYVKKKVASSLEQGALSREK
jgi:predicted PurR-regulated permease PerM